jgi:uncharacterized protein (TIGR00296 family)
MNKKLMEKAVKIARETIELWVKKKKKLKPKDFPEQFREKSGVFVTIHTYPEKELRGCIGYPEPIMPLIQALIEAAIEASRDPRFPPLEENELDKIIIEVSVLTQPEMIEVKDPAEYPEKIEIGKDGLVIRKNFHSGLFLPSVPVEQKWDAKEYLENLCLKAGLMPNEWQDESARIYKFQTIVCSEKRPRSL